MSGPAKSPTLGFTLIEMSIVLVIIGLIVGGIMLGQSLIRASQLQSVLTDVKRFTDAVQNFRQKYNALPGDMINATSYWGANTPGTNGCSGYNAVTTSPTSTCNGNGDGHINGGYGSSGVVSQAMDEEFLAWKHLANAGFVENAASGLDNGSYGGVVVNATIINGVTVGANAMPSKIKQAGYLIFTNLDIWAPAGNGDIYPTNNVNHVILFGGNYSGNASLFGAVITASEALSLDTKVDDGMPGSGKIKSPAGGCCSSGWDAWGTQNCATNSTPLLAMYNVTQAGNACSLMFDIE